MYEAILHMKSGNLINLGKVTEEQKQWLLINSWWEKDYTVEFNGFYFNFSNVDMMQFKEVSDETVS